MCSDRKSTFELDEGGKRELRQPGEFGLGEHPETASVQRDDVEIVDGDLRPGRVRSLDHPPEPVRPDCIVRIENGDPPAARRPDAGIACAARTAVAIKGDQADPGIRDRRNERGRRIC